MPTGIPGGSDLGFFGQLLQEMFSLSLPLRVITLCGASYILAYNMRMPEFVLWAYLGQLAIDQAHANTWWAVGLGAFALVALPFAWVVLKEREVLFSSTIYGYLLAGVFTAFMLWLRSAWPYDRNMFQVIVYGIVLFLAWNAGMHALLGTIGIAAHIRENRPVKTEPPPQQPHGARDERRSRREPETI